MDDLSACISQLKRFIFDEVNTTFVGLTVNRQMVSAVRSLLTDLLRNLQSMSAPNVLREKCVGVYGHVDLVFGYYENRHTTADSIRHLTPQLLNAEIQSLVEECSGWIAIGTQETTLFQEGIKICDQIYWKYNRDVPSAFFACGNAHLKLDDTPYEPVSGEVGIHYDAHGVAKGTLREQFQVLWSLLEKGIDPGREFHTAPFEVPADRRAAFGAGLGTGGGTAYKDGLAIVTGSYGRLIREGGIKFVFINDVAQDLISILRRAFPKYEIHKLSEQKEVLKNK